MPRLRWATVVETAFKRPPKPPKPTRAWRDGKWVLVWPKQPDVRD